LTAEQLQAARAAHWRQNQRPILTLDDAQSWIEQHPLCLYLPRRTQLPAPAPSFVEACMGSAQATPGPAALEQAQALLTRLIASGKVVALNLLGGVSEQPDFLAHQQALPYVLCLRADSDWKHAPQKSSGHKVSPLVLELWKALDKDGVLTAAEARETLGRELTEAAVLRALCELWQALRITPGFAEPGQPARWELLRMRHREALATAGTTSQVTSLSLLVSMYLQSVYAASSEEIEIFLSPVASRSRVREAVRGLAATRQIQSLSMDAQTYYFLEEGLPEFAEAAAAPAANAERPRPPARVEVPRRSFSAPGNNQAARPAAATGWTAPRRAEKVAGSRPPLRPARSFSSADGRTAENIVGGPGRGAGASRPQARPETRGRAPEKRQSAPLAAQKRPQTGPRNSPKNERGPAPWARTGQGSRSGPRPAAAGGRGSFPNRPGAGPARPPGSTPPSAGGPRPAKGRPDTRPDTRAGARPEFRQSAPPGAQKRPPTGAKYSPKNQRGPAPWVRTGPASRSASRPASAAGRGNFPRPGASPARPPGSPPSVGGQRPPKARWVPGGARPPASFRPKEGRSPNPDGRARRQYDRPGAAGGQKSAANPAFPRDDRKSRSPFAPGSRPPGSWPRASSGKPGGKRGKPPGKKPRV
jgi:23S rRNA pseudouridine2605 synthase